MALTAACSAGMGNISSHHDSDGASDDWQESYGATSEPVPPKGLRNPARANNCFLNADLQALWHCAPFRAALAAGAVHTHPIGAAPCVTCALRSVYAWYEYADETVVPPDDVRVALAQLNVAQNRFKLGAMEDASETLCAILERLHLEALEAREVVRIDSGNAADEACSSACVAHAAFGMEYFWWWRCAVCGASTDPVPHTALTYAASASRIGDAWRSVVNSPRRSGAGGGGGIATAVGASCNPAVVHQGVGGITPKAAQIAGEHRLNANAFGAALSRLAAEDAASEQLAAQRSLAAACVGGGCRSCTPVPERYGLSLPRVFAVTLGWPRLDSTAAEVEDVVSLVHELLDLRQLFHFELTAASSPLAAVDRASYFGDWRAEGEARGRAALRVGAEGREGHAECGASAHTGITAAANRSTLYRLRCVTCFYGRHYISFVASEALRCWVQFDDARWSRVGSWTDVEQRCIKSRYRPTVLFYEQLGPLEVRSDVHRKSWRGESGTVSGSGHSHSTPLTFESSPAVTGTGVGIGRDRIAVDTAPESSRSAGDAVPCISVDVTSDSAINRHSLQLTAATVIPSSVARTPVDVTADSPEVSSNTCPIPARGVIPVAGLPNAIALLDAQQPGRASPAPLSSRDATGRVELPAVPPLLHRARSVRAPKLTDDAASGVQQQQQQQQRSARSSADDHAANT